MINLHKDELWKFDFNEALKIFQTSWTGKYFNNELFKEKTELIAEKTKEHKPMAFLANTLNFNFVMTPNLQKWHNELLFPIFQEVGLQKMAFVIPKELFSQVAIEQAYKEVEDIYNITENEYNKNKYGFITAYFKTEKEALEWIKA